MNHLSGFVVNKFLLRVVLQAQESKMSSGPFLYSNTELYKQVGLTP